MDNTEVLTNKIEDEINKNNKIIKNEINSNKEDKNIMMVTATLYGIYLISAIFITKYLTANSPLYYSIHNFNVNTNIIVYSVLGLAPSIPISLFELSFYKNIKKSKEQIKILNSLNKKLELEKENIKDNKKEFSKIKSRIDLHYICLTKEHKYLKLYKKGKLNIKLQKKYCHEDIKYIDEYIEEHNKIKIKQV